MARACISSTGEAGFLVLLVTSLAESVSAKFNGRHYFKKQNDEWLKKTPN